MRKVLIIVLMGVMLALSACSRGPSPAVETAAINDAPEVLPTADPERVQETAEGAIQPAADELPARSEPDACLDCHSSPQMLIESAAPVGEISTRGTEALEPWEKVLVDTEKFPQSVHGLNGCVSCHGGVQDADKEAAHTGMTADPSQEPQALCGECHPNVVSGHENNLHTNLNGFWHALDERSMPGDHPALEEAFENQCASCHTTCGDCHISQPEAAGGGLLDGHLFNRTPSMTRNCIACHDSRVGSEFLGASEELAADVHYAQGSMECVDCHNGHELHGQPAECKSCHVGPESESIPPPDHRYAGVQSPRCESCHMSVSTGGDGILMHEMHGSKLSCQVCHSIAYTNCESCHLSGEQNGQPVFEAASTYFAFLIGRNPMQTYDRPYEYVPVRHVPVDPDSFDFYGDDLLKNFDDLETWKYATPHNIQRNTPQTATCTACHGSDEFFLTLDKVAPEEVEANRNVIVDGPPPEISSSEQFR